MASKRGKRLTPLRAQYEAIAKRIKRLGYGYQLPETPKRITAKSYEKLSQIEATAKEASKARKAAQERVRYYKKKGYDLSGISVPKGLTKEEYQSYTAEYIKERSYSAPNYRQNADGNEAIQDYVNRYGSTIDTIDRISDLLENFELPTNRRHATDWVMRKRANHSLIQMYWFDVIDPADITTKVQMAARINGKAEELYHLIDDAIHGSSSPESDSNNIASIIETITGAKLTAIEQDAINAYAEVSYDVYL